MGVRDDVAVTKRAEDFWRASDLTAMAARIPWRYIGTANGVFRQFPGTPSNKFYDHVIRPW